MKEKKSLVIGSTAGLAAGAVILLCAAALIRGLGGIVGRFAGEPLGSVFAQLKTAALSLPWALVLLPCAGYGCLCGFLWKRSRRAAHGFLIAGGIVLFLLLFFACVWNADVNSIRFGTVIRSLITQIGNGLLEEL